VGRQDTGRPVVPKDQRILCAFPVEKKDTNAKTVILYVVFAKFLDTPHLIADINGTV